MLSTVSSTWQWRADGTDIPGATSPTYTVQPGDVGKTLSVAEHLTATGYQATTLVSGVDRRRPGAGDLAGADADGLRYAAGRVAAAR